VLARSPLRRFWLIAAVFELLLPTFASVADARSEAASILGASAHVEAPGSTRCPPVHPEDCVVCRVLGTYAVGASPPSAPEPAVRLRCSSIDDAAHPLRSAKAPGDPSQRAPPLRA
jgi:hypothetical protein